MSLNVNIISITEEIRLFLDFWLLAYVQVVRIYSRIFARAYCQYSQDVI